MRRGFLPVLMLLVCGGAAARDGGFEFNHVALAVRDPAVSVRFYSTVFGLPEIVNRTQVDGIRWMALGDGRELHLISGFGDPPTPFKTTHFAFTATDFDAFLATLVARDIAYQTWTGEAGQVTVRADGARQVYLQDPDGYWIEVNAAAPVTSFHWRWPEDSGGALPATIHDGGTLDLAALAIDAETLERGASRPRPPGELPFEELLIVKAGSVNVEIDGRPYPGLGPGSAVLTYPGLDRVIVNRGSEPAVFYRFAYASRSGADAARGKAAGGPIVADWDRIDYQPSDIGGRRQMFDRPTAMLGNFEMHVSTLNGGLTNHPAHTHRAEEFVLVVEGDVRLQLGDEHVTAGPGDVIFIESMIPHSLDNIGERPATYFAFQHTL